MRRHFRCRLVTALRSNSRRSWGGRKDQDFLSGSFKAATGCQINHNRLRLALVSVCTANVVLGLQQRVTEGP